MKGLKGRYRWLDRILAAGARFDEVAAGRMAAAATYYSFFAVFAMTVVGFAIMGFVLRNNQHALGEAEDYVNRNLPTLDVSALVDARRTLGILGLGGLLAAGLAWIDVTRSTVRAVWRVEQYPGKFIGRRAIDALALAGIGALLAGSFGVAFAVQAGVGLVADVGWLNSAVGLILGLAINLVFAAALLTVVPRLRMPWQRILGPALLVAVGFELLKTVGAIYIRHTSANPAYQVAAGAVGLLLFLNLLNQLLLFAAALAATADEES